MYIHMCIYGTYKGDQICSARKELLQLLRGFAHLGSEEPIVLPELPNKMWSKLVRDPRVQGPSGCGFELLVVGVFSSPKTRNF